MKRFAQLFTEVDQTNSTLKKVAALHRYFEDAPQKDRLWAIALLTGKRPRRPVKSSLMRAWAAELAGIPTWLFEESYGVVGDLGETIALLVPRGHEQRPAQEGLSDWMEWIEKLRGLEEEEQKAEVVSAWQQLSDTERFVLNKLIGGGFRMGVSQKLTVRALAAYTGREENVLAHRLMGKWSPTETSFNDLILSEDSSDDDSRPYPFCLAYALEQEVEDLGPIHDWQAEYKWDGIRGQLIKRGGEWFLWSRGEELINEGFPDFEAIADNLPDGSVLDGEILPWSEGGPLGFQVLQSRLGRKKVGSALIKKTPVAFMVYDLLEHEGNDLREQPLAERMRLLDDLFASIPPSPVLLQSRRLSAKAWDTLITLREEARAMGAEGLMLKSTASVYHVGRKKGDWWKWKIDPLTIDAIMIYAQRGHGRRANLYTDYTFAVWKGEELVPFTKAYSGLTDKEIGELDAWIKRHTRDRFGPVRSVDAEQVFEIAFEGIQASSRHKSGVALRFPRIKRWRKDKPKEEANTLEDLQNLLQSYQREE